MSNNKKIALGLVIVCSLSALLAFNFWMNRVVADNFQGQLQEVKGTKLYIDGIYALGDNLINPEIIIKGVEVSVTSETRFIKTLWYLPSMEELKKTKGRWNPDEIRKEQVEGSLDDLFKQQNRSPISVRVISEKNIYNLVGFEAGSIEYVKMVDPARPDL